MTGGESEGLSAEELYRLQVACERTTTWVTPFSRDVVRSVLAQARRASSSEPGREGADYQARVGAWMDDVFAAGGADTRTRIDRFLEEAFELAQALDYDPGRITTIRDYVFARPVGEKGQEMGGVMVTLASLAHAAEIDMAGEAEGELARIHRPEVRAKIMAKQASKNGLHTPLPTPAAPASAPLPVGEDAQPYKDALHDLVMLKAQRDIGCVPAPSKEQWAKAWAEAEELTRVEP